jgi:exodeoxyribonuclease VII large subunit
MITSKSPMPEPAVWQVGALCLAIAGVIDTRFNPIAVRGEISGFSRAVSGHCYFSLKDDLGQIRCALFRRAAQLLDFSPRDGEQVELLGRLDLYAPRGDLQLIVQGMSRVGPGVLFEQFLKLKAKLLAEGLFDASRKRALPLLPRGIGVVTSLGAAALQDVAASLRRRVPHIPVVLAATQVQGHEAPTQIIEALLKLYLLTQSGQALGDDSVIVSESESGFETPVVDVILLVRGGGSAEDLWAFNDEQLARTLAHSPVPVVCGVGHETDFTIADFVADLRAATPTAAAELVAQPRDVMLGALVLVSNRLHEAACAQLDYQGQRLDQMLSCLGRPSVRLAQQGVRLTANAQRLQLTALQSLKQGQQTLQALQVSLPDAMASGLKLRQERLQRAALRLGLLDPSLVLQRGYAWLSSANGEPISSVEQTRVGQPVRATLADGTVDLTVTGRI